MPSPDYQCQEEESPQYLGVKVSRDSVWVKWRAAGVPSIPLKQPKHRLTHSLTLVLSSSEGTATRKAPGIQGGIELSGFRARTGGAALSQTEVLADAIVRWVSLPPHRQQTQAGARLSCHQTG